MSTKPVNINVMRGAELQEKFGDSLAKSFTYHPKEIATASQFLTIQDHNVLLGVAQIDLLRTNEYLNFIEVVPSARNRGYSHQLLKASFNFSADHSKRLLISEFSDLGKLYLLRELERLKAIYPQIEVEHARFC